jgi:hypothetical protein
MRTPPKQDFATILHLAEMYCEQYRGRNLYLSPEQNEASFRDFVGQYYGALYWGKTINLVIDVNVPLF